MTALFARPGLFAIAATVVVGSAVAVAAQPDHAWVARMDAFAALVGQILPDAFGGAAEDVAVRDERLRRDGRALAELAHSVRDMAYDGESGDYDPTVPMLAHELERAAQDMSHSHGELLLDDAAFVGATCIGCHTRGSRGAARPRSALAPVDARLAAWLRGDVLAATRRIEPARAAFHEAIFDERFAAAEPYLWERAVHRALVIDVRVARDPVDALDVVSQVLGSPAGQPLWDDAGQWDTSLRAWRRELASRSPRIPRDLFREAGECMTRAQALEATPGAGGAFIEYLRATAALHELLGKGPLPDRKRAMALDWLGEAYESLRDVDVWSLYQLYDEACIEAAPHTTAALNCYVRLERNIMIDERGNSGQPLAEDSSARLARLRLLAQPARKQ